MNNNNNVVSVVLGAISAISFATYIYAIYNGYTYSYKFGFIAGIFTIALLVSLLLPLKKRKESIEDVHKILEDQRRRTARIIEISNRSNEKAEKAISALNALGRKNPNMSIKENLEPSIDYQYWQRAYDQVIKLWTFTDKLISDNGFHKITNEFSGVNIQETGEEKIGHTFEGKLRYLVMLDIVENINRGGHLFDLSQGEGLILSLYFFKLARPSFTDNSPEIVYTEFTEKYSILAKGCEDMVYGFVNSIPQVSEIFLISHSLSDYSKELQYEYLRLMYDTAITFSNADNNLNTEEKEWLKHLLCLIAECRKDINK